jgi:hypothetical protein
MCETSHATVLGLDVCMTWNSLVDLVRQAEWASRPFIRCVGSSFSDFPDAHAQSMAWLSFHPFGPQWHQTKTTRFRFRRSCFVPLDRIDVVTCVCDDGARNKYHHLIFHRACPLELCSSLLICFCTVCFKSKVDAHVSYFAFVQLSSQGCVLSA